jgi:hypothetical protein
MTKRVGIIKENDPLRIDERSLEIPEILKSNFDNHVIYNMFYLFI